MKDNSADNDESIVISARLPRELVEFLDEAKVKMCNTRVGVIRFAVTQLKEGMSAALPSEPKTEPQAAAA